MGKYSHYSTGDTELEALASKLPPPSASKDFDLHAMRKSINAAAEGLGIKPPCKFYRSGQYDMLIRAFG